MKALYGPEYPEAVTISGVRMPLQKETRFSRYYHSEAANAGASVSKFSDGTAAITFAELQNEWPQWSDDERANFCGSCSWLGRQPDFPDMLRFIMRVGTPDHWRSIALGVAEHLPQEEAFRVLLDALERIDQHTANITQGISHTKHPEAKRVLAEHLGRLWMHPKLWDDASFTNWHAFDALCCIQHLLWLGVAPADVEDKVRRLAEHLCSGNRESCSNYLHKYYDWLPEPKLPPFDRPGR